LIDYKTIRNALVSGLNNYTGKLAVLADHSKHKPPYPYVTVKFSSLLDSDSMNPNEFIQNVEGGVVVKEITNPEMMVSVNCYGEGDEDSIDLALNAYSWFKTVGHFELEEKGIVVISMESIQNRDTVLGDVTYERKQGFDVRLRVKGEVSYTVENIDNVELNQEWITKGTSQKGFGTPLILSTSGSLAYKEYGSIDEVSADFSSGTTEYDIAAAVFGQGPSPEKIAIHGVTYDTAGGSVPSDLTDALNTLIVDHNDFYFLLSTENGANEVEELSNWIDNQNKMYFVSTDDQTVYAGALNSDRAVVMVTNQPSEYPAEAWVGACAPYAPGTITWTFKNLNGISNSGLMNSEIDSVESANGNAYIQEGGVLITSDSKTTSGEFIDVIRTKDWLEARITEGVFSLLANTKKVRFTNAGIAQVVAAVEAPLKRAVSSGVIARDGDDKALYTVKAPTRSEISQTDRSNRKLPGVTFTGTISGAIEDVDIAGSIEV